MTIAVDADDMRTLQKHLREAAAEIRGAMPTMPGGSAFGPAILAGAAASFASSVRSQAESLGETWSALDESVGATFADMAKTEAQIVSGLKSLAGGLS